MADVSQFNVPVDSEHKSTILRIWYFSKPHHRAFHLSWLGFFFTFLATFAPAALIPVIRESLSLTKQDITNAGAAAVSGTVIARIFMGTLCDLLGPRVSMGMTLLITSAPVFGIALVTDHTDFLWCRFGIGFGLATFVTCQYWTSSMFNVRIVGTANAVAAGWGNLGGGVTHMLLPAIYEGIKHHTIPFEAWRWAFFVPGIMCNVLGLAILLFGQDLPDGNYDDLERDGSKKKDKGWKVFVNAVTNYRVLICMILYACCFGVELTMDNIITTYFYDQFDLPLTTAGTLGAIFGLLNIFSRAAGGWTSDVVAKRFGMRGRLWVVFLCSLLGGIFCIAMALAENSLGATIALMMIFSVFVQAACGTVYGVVPFVSKRSMGQVSGFVGAGGNLGSVASQFLFFNKNSISTPTGILYTGIFIICGTMTTVLLYFPPWGSMFTGPRDGATEEDYYLGEYSAEERAAGLADAAMKFAIESKSQRGFKAGLEITETAKSTDVADAEKP